jgi:hypothetical protein
MEPTAVEAIAVMRRRAATVQAGRELEVLDTLRRDMATAVNTRFGAQTATTGGSVAIDGSDATSIR